MYKYIIQYSETYCRSYDIIADDREQAKDMLYELICNGEVHDPDVCIDSRMTIVSEEIMNEGPEEVKEITVTVGNHIQRREITVKTESCIIQAFIDAGVKIYPDAGFTLDGVILHHSDLFKTFRDFDVEDDAFLLEVVKSV